MRKSSNVILVLLLLISVPCFAEGQRGMGEFFALLYFISFLFYTVFGGIIIIGLGKLIGFSKSRKFIISPFFIALLLTLIFFIVDDGSYFILFFWSI